MSDDPTVLVWGAVLGHRGQLEYLPEMLVYLLLQRVVRRVATH